MDQTLSATPSRAKLQRPGERLPLRIEALEAYDIEPALIDIWRETIGPRLLPVQERAIKEFNLFGGGNLVVFSPTSSGKTFIGEMAAVKAARANTRVFYLVPQRALAEEKYREFRQRYAPIGIDVVVSSRDHRQHDAQIRDRQFEVAVVVFEKLRALLVSQPNLLTDVGLVVVDELQMLTDPERGATLELLLTKLRMAPTRPRLIGLSAVLGRAEALTEWLDARLLMDQRRPVELRKGVLCQGEYRYQEHNSGSIGTESFRHIETKDRNELMLAAAQELVERGEQVLLFVPDRASAVALARLLSSRVTLPIASAALEELREAEETHMRDTLAQTLENAVAFHHADMTSDEREIVERAFRDGHVRALVATSTLAMGVNLPTKNVVLDGRRWETNGPFDRPALVDLGKSEYENMSGRAGRLAFTNDFGRSILVTHSRYQAESWLETYIAREFENIVPTLNHDRIEDIVLDLVASGMARSRASLTEILLASFTGRVHWTATMGREAFVEAVTAAVGICAEGGLVRQGKRDTLSITKIGKVAASRSIGAETAAVFAKWAQAGHAAPPAPIEILTLLGQSMAGGEVYIRYSYREDREVDYKGELLGRLNHAGLGERPVFGPYTKSSMALEDDEAKTVKKALMLQDWIDEMPTRDLEQRYETWAGSIRRIGEEYGWLCEGLAAICAACGWRSGWRRSIEQLGERLTFGVKEDAVDVMKLRVRRLGRAAMPRLRDYGLLDLAELRKAGPEQVKRAIGGRRVVEALLAKLAEPQASPLSSRVAIEKEGPRAAGAMVVAAAEGAAPYGGLATNAADGPDSVPVPSHQPQAQSEAEGKIPDAVPSEVDLFIDIPSRRTKLWGVELATRPPRNLQPQLFYALASLALHADAVVSMADLAEEIQRLGGLSRKPVAPDARDLRYRILRALRAGIGDHKNADKIEGLIENHHGCGLRLSCTTQVLRARDELAG
jgi:helicase